MQVSSMPRHTEAPTLSEPPTTDYIFYLLGGTVVRSGDFGLKTRRISDWYMRKCLIRDIVCDCKIRYRHSISLTKADLRPMVFSYSTIQLMSSSEISDRND